MSNQPDGKRITESGLSEAMERAVRREEVMAAARQPRQRVRVTSCMFDDCANEVRRSNVFAICTNHLLLIWRHVENTNLPMPHTMTGAPPPTWDFSPAREIVTEEDMEVRRLAKRQKLREAAVAHGFLYVLDTQNDTVKIGWTGDLWQRLNAYPPHFRLIVSVPGTRADERDVHRSLKLARTAGREWYNVTPEVVRQINSWIALANTINAQLNANSKAEFGWANPDLDFKPFMLPKFTTLAEWTHDGRENDIVIKDKKPAPQSRSGARRVG